MFFFLFDFGYGEVEPRVIKQMWFGFFFGWYIEDLFVNILIKFINRSQICLKVRTYHIGRDRVFFWIIHEVIFNKLVDFHIQIRELSVGKEIESILIMQKHRIHVIQVDNFVNRFKQRDISVK